MPYISSFLPSQKKRFWRKGGGDPRPSRIPLKPNPKQKDIDAAEGDLNSEVANDLKWCLSDTIQSKWGHLGVTRLAHTDEPWEILDFDTVLNSDMMLRFKGKKRRPLIIGIMKEFVTAMNGSGPRSEQRLRATFMAAITMVHEVGHAIFHNDFRSLNPIKEPYVGDSCEAELGFSFVSWIFSGFHPLNIPGDMEFNDTLFWDPQETLSSGERPLYKTRYSIPISYIERIMSEEFWDSLGNPSKLRFSDRAREELRPKIDGKGGPVATATSPNWAYSHLLRRPLWKEQHHYKMPGFQERNRIKGLAIEEIDRERKQTKENQKYAFMSKEERHKRYRETRSRNGMHIPDKDDVEFWDESDESPSEPSKPTVAKPLEPLKQNLGWNDSKPDGGSPSLKRPRSKSTSTKNPSKRARVEDEIEEIGDGDIIMEESQGKTRTAKEVGDGDIIMEEPQGKMRTANEHQRNAPQEFVPISLSSIMTKSAEIVNRVVDIEDLIYEPGPRPQKQRMLGTHILEEIEDFEAITGISKVLGRKGATNLRLKPPSSHMQDIYDQIMDGGDSQD